MRLGLLVPMWAEGDRQPSWPVLERYAREAESAGFDSLWVCDDAIFRIDGAVLGVLGCVPTAAALCAVTSAIEVGTLVANVHSRSPALLAKDADTLAIVSGGRFVLGLGAGDDRAQHAALGMIWDGRFGAYEEAVEIVATLLRSGAVDFAGSHYRARAAELAPRGPQPRGPRILVGGKGPRMLRIAAEWADAWNAYLAWYGGDVRELLPRVDAACERAGRDPRTLERTVAVAAAFDDHPIRIGPKLLADVGVRGDEGRIAEYLVGMAELGISHVQVQTAPLDLWALERLAGVLADVHAA